MPKIAILDSGVHLGHPHIGAVAGGFDATSNRADWVDRVGHGTAVAAAIRSHAPDAELLVVKIFEGGLRTNLDILVRGISWSIEQGADLINLSLGSSNEAHAEVLGEWVARGSLWVSAAGAYPGQLAGVISVAADGELERHQLRHIEALHFAASPYPREIPGVSRERNLRGISFAVANATGLIANDWARFQASFLAPGDPTG